MGASAGGVDSASLTNAAVWGSLRRYSRVALYLSRWLGGTSSQCRSARLPHPVSAKGGDEVRARVAQCDYCGEVDCLFMLCKNAVGVLP